MSEPDHLKCPCQQCGGTIEFPSDGAGLSVNCPHCGEPTILLVLPPEEAQEVRLDTHDPLPSKGRRNVIALLLLVVAVAAGTYVFRDKLTRTRPDQDAKDPTPHQRSMTAESPVVRTNPPTPAKVPKSIDDLKVGAITLEKARGSSLVYATGVLRNESDHQRFGVNLELEMTDARGAKAGTARDYRAVLEPRQEWRFRALVLDSKAVSARVAGIREEE